MRWIWIGLLLTAWMTGWAQVGPGVLGPFAGTLDGAKRFAVDTPLGWRIAGKFQNHEDNVPPGTRLEIFLEPRPGISEIVGIGNVGAIWVVLPGLDPVRLTGFSIVTEPRLGFDLGEFTAPAPPPCTDCTSQVRILADDGSLVQFWHRHCSGGRWGPWGLLRAGRGTALPAEVGTECTWFVLLTEDKDKLTYAFFHSDGRAWIEKGRLVVPLVLVRPVSCEVCQYVAVNEGGNHRTLYHCERLGVWKLIGEWGRPEPPPVRVPRPPPGPP
ncbi:MAG: hypothetical protein N2320_04445 [Candidatus Bipolaricaulota bacterium]|nr:hypothetical protein [Candidatus Bipolaricaulota bacterium]